MIDALFVALQRALPKRALSALVLRLSRLEGGGATRWAIRAFARVYRVDLDEAEIADPAGYATFNAFFTRALRAGARPRPADPGAVSAAADGTVSESGALHGSRLLQVKGRTYDLDELLDGDAALAAHFRDGAFQTTYLAPRDYHRVHMPLAGSLRAVRYVPGTLFSVNARTTRALPRLFCRNERVITAFEHGAGWFAVILVGALNVGSIELVVPPPRGFANRPRPAQLAGRTLALDGPALARGDELGRFNLGSSVIVLASPGLLRWDPALGAGSPVRVGQAVGRLCAG